MSRLFDHAKAIVQNNELLSRIVEAKNNNKCSSAVVRRFLRLCDNSHGPDWKSCDQQVSLFLLEECRHHDIGFLILRRSAAMHKAIAHSCLEKTNEPLTLKVATSHDRDRMDEHVLRIKATLF